MCTLEMEFPETRLTSTVQQEARSDVLLISESELLVSGRSAYAVGFGGFELRLKIVGNGVALWGSAQGLGLRSLKLELTLPKA